MTTPKRTVAEIEQALAGLRYESREEAIATAHAVAEPGDEIRIHDFDCKIDDGACTCEPVVVIAGERTQA